MEYIEEGFMDLLRQGFQELWKEFDSRVLLFMPLVLFETLATLSIFSWGIMKLAGIPINEFSDFQMMWKVTLWSVLIIAPYTYFAWPYFPK